MILNERDRRLAKAQIETLEEAFDCKVTLEPLLAGLPPALVSESVDALKNRLKTLKDALHAYDLASSRKDARPLIELANKDPGLSIIVARIAKGLTQKELARLLGVKEQQIQRYEADRYRSINLEKYQMLALLLGVNIEISINPWAGRNLLLDDIDQKSMRKIVDHGKKNGWFSEQGSVSELKKFLATNRISYLTPTKLRTGLNTNAEYDEVLLHAWRARVYSRAKPIIAANKCRFDFLEYTWLKELVELTRSKEGPRKAVELLTSKGIVVIVEPHIEGLGIDGAAFEIDGVPIIGLTLLRDRLDNFWFTLLHELGHVIFHFDKVKLSGFYDQIDEDVHDIEEIEANRFAADMLIPDEIWRTSSIRVSNDPKAIEEFAKKLNIHPSIVFGRLQRERNNYSQFSKNLVSGVLRNTFFKELV